MAQDPESKSPFTAGFERDVKSLVMLKDYGVMSALEVRDNLASMGVVLHEPEKVFWFMQAEAEAEELVRQAREAEDSGYEPDLDDDEVPVAPRRRRAPWDNEQED